MSTKIQNNIAEVKKSGLIAIIRGKFSYQQINKIAETLLGNGVNVMEITLNTTSALEAISRLHQEFGNKIIIGAGTVRNVKQLEDAMSAGAEFTVAPNFDLATVELAIKKDFLHLPGVFTPTEMQNAYNHGCRLLKVFPSDVVGAKYIKAVRAPLDDIDLVPTGGITPENLYEYIAAGAAALGIGSALVTGPDQAMEDLAKKAQALRAAWIKAKN